MVALNTDFSTVTPAIGGALPVKPEGWYTGMVVETTSKGTRDSQQTGNAMLECKIAFQDGSFFIERFNLWHSNEDTKRIATENLAAMLAAMGLSGQQLRISDTSQFHNLPFDLYLAVEESKTDKGNTIKQNRMKAVRMKDGKVIGNVPAATGAPAGAPAGAAPAAPPAGGFNAPAAPPAQPAPGPAAFGGQPAQPWGGQPQPGAPQAPQPPQPPAQAFQPGGFPQPGGAPPAAPPALPGGGFPQPGGGPWGGPQQ